VSFTLKFFFDWIKLEYSLELDIGFSSCLVFGNEECGEWIDGVDWIGTIGWWEWFLLFFFFWFFACFLILCFTEINLDLVQFLHSFRNIKLL
jgi:hypothetical protein